MTNFRGALYTGSGDPVDDRGAPNTSTDNVLHDNSGLQSSPRLDPSLGLIVELGPSTPSRLHLPSDLFERHLPALPSWPHEHRRRTSDDTQSVRVFSSSTSTELQPCATDGHTLIALERE